MLSEKQSQTNNLPNVLIVDDLPENLYALKKSLEVLNVNVDLAHSGNEALLKMLEKHYAVVILDVQMPEMDGFEVAQVMHENKDTCHIPLIFVTAINKEDNHVFHGYKMGAVDYIFKPINPNILRCKVKVFIDLYLIQRQLENSKADIENTLNSVADCIITVDHEGIIKHCNTAALLMLDTDMSTVKDRKIFDLITLKGEESNEIYQDKIFKKIKDFRIVKYSERICFTNSNNKSYIVELSTVPLLNISSQYIGLVFTIHDVTESSALVKKLHFQTTHDPITQLPNRQHFLEQLKFSVLKAKQFNISLAILYIGLEGMKQIIDAKGHKHGDELIKQISERLIRTLNNKEICARVGDEAFVVLIEHCDSTDYVTSIAQVLIDVISKPYTVFKKVVYVESCIGISLYPQDGKDSEVLIRNADAAMHAAKTTGMNLYQLFEKSMQTKAEFALKITHDLREALEKNQFALHYQPQCIIQNNKDETIGFESLIRWIHPERGLIPPNDFIPIAESTGIIKAVDKWVLREACLAITKFKALTTKPLHVAVNISTKEFNDKNFIENIVACFNEIDVNPSEIEIEVTESIFINNVDEVVDKIKKLKEIGVTVAIDDFGTGYSNLAYLKNIPVDVLKIDQIFIKNLLVSNKDNAIARAIIELGKHLHIKVIAEGVETQEQLEWLKDNGCYAIQGFLHARPMDWEQIIEYLKQLKK